MKLYDITGFDYIEVNGDEDWEVMSNEPAEQPPSGKATPIEEIEELLASIKTPSVPSRAISARPSRAASPCFSDFGLNTLFQEIPPRNPPINPVLFGHTSQTRIRDYKNDFIEGLFGLIEYAINVEMI